MAKIPVPFLLRWSFLIPRCSSFILSLDMKLIFFCRQELLSARLLFKFFLSFRKMVFEKVGTALWDVLLVLLTIFFTFDNRFISLVRSFVPTWTIRMRVFCSLRSLRFLSVSAETLSTSFSLDMVFVAVSLVAVITSVSSRIIVSSVVISSGVSYWLSGNNTVASLTLSVFTIL